MCHRLAPEGDETLFRHFKNTKAMDLVSGRTIVVADASDALASAWEKLILNDVLSVPVMQNGKAFGFLDVVDILSFLMQGELDDQKRVQKFKKAKCGDVSNHSERDMFLKLVETADMWTACNVMADFGKLHRVPIVNLEDALVGLISQSDVLEWIQPFIEENEIGNKTIKEIGLGMDKDVISIPSSKTVREAFLLLLKHNVSGIAVTGKLGELYGNICATDINYIVKSGPDAMTFELLDQTVEQFMKELPPNPIFGYNPIFITPVDSIRVLVRKLVDSHIHRIFVVHNAMHICGIISLIDVISYLLNKAAPQIPEK